MPDRVLPRLNILLFPYRSFLVGAPITDLYDLTLKWEDDDKTTTIQNSTSDPEIPDQEVAEVSATETAQIVESTGSTTGMYIHIFSSIHFIHNLSFSHFHSIQKFVCAAFE